MSRLNELIKELCPNGVEYKRIQDICSVKGRIGFRGYTRNDLVASASEGAISLSPSNLENNSIILDKTSYVSWDKYYESPEIMAEVGDIALCKTASVGKSAIIRDLPHHITINPQLVLLKNISCDSIYLSYVICGNTFQNQIARLQGVGSVPNVPQSKLNEIRVPVPPLEVQREIVRVLDHFTLLSAELSAELKDRKLQYEYYLNDLLSIENLNPQEIKYVGDLFEIKNGLNKEKSAFGHGTPIINFTDVYNHRYITSNMIKGKVSLTDEEIERYRVKKGDVFFTRTSETAQDVGMSSTIVDEIKDCTFSGFVLRARPQTDLLLPKFCSYYFATNQVRDNIVRYASVTTRATTTGPKLSKIPVPIISKERQSQIVSILDRFDSLCNDISAGLPAEIEARQKQYEYYRDKLLSFEEKKEA